MGLAFGQDTEVGETTQLSIIPGGASEKHSDDPSECLFCDIRDRKTEAVEVYEDESTLAFLDHRPLFHGHVLVIPKQHVDNVFECPFDLSEDVFHAVKLIAAGVKEAMQSTGILIITNNGVSQSVDHLHVHVIPRTKGDGLRGFMWPRHRYVSPAEANDVGAAIRHALDELAPDS